MLDWFDLASSSSTATSTSLLKAAQSNSGSQTESRLLFDTTSQTDPVSDLQPLKCTESPSFEVNLGREPRELPTVDVGHFRHP